MKHQIDDPDLLDISDPDASAKTIVAKVLEEREKGHPVTDAQVLSAYPHLQDSLKYELGVLDKIRQAMLAAKRTASESVRLPPLANFNSDDLLQASNPSIHGDEHHTEVQPSLPGYLLVGETVRGGQAVVYQAIQESTGRKVAIKVMSGGPFASSNHRLRFEREAKILASLDHPNIVSIFERARTPDGSFFFVMPYVEGMALDEYWNTQVPRTIEGCRDLVRLFSKILQAVQVAHSRGVVHRDLKPSNIRVDCRGEPHILDFGLARPVDELCDSSARTITVPGQIIGSLPWASPEQAAGNSMGLDARSDVYSIGVMLFQAMTGNFPYSLQGAIDEVLLRIRKQNAQPPTDCPNARPGVNDQLGWIALKALEKFPERRYQTAADFGRDLDAWFYGEAVVARPRKQFLQWKYFAAVAAIVLCAGLLSIVPENKPQPTITTVNLPTIGNSIGMTLVKISPGSFLMGSPDTEAGHTPDEHQRYATIDHAYYVATTETTQAQFEKVMKSNPSDPKWRGPNLPVQNVSMDQANEFCQRLSKMEGDHYRLPTEIEWEYACRANNLDPFPILDRPTLTVNFLESNGGQIQAVGCRKPNAWGLFDMQGNVEEWSSDHNSNALNGKIGIIRGGSALLGTSECRAASRKTLNEASSRPDLGFRIVRDP